MNVESTRFGEKLSATCLGYVLLPWRERVKRKATLLEVQEMDRGLEPLGMLLQDDVEIPNRH